MKYLYLLVVMVMVGCSDKSPKIEKSILPENTAKMVQVEAPREVVSKVIFEAQPVMNYDREEVMVAAPEVVSMVTEESSIVSTSEVINAVNEENPIISSAEVVNVVHEENPVVSTSKTVITEPTVTKNIGANVPSSCVMWSDGCNVCTRQGRGKASCTTNPECQHKVFSCLQWQ